MGKTFRAGDVTVVMDIVYGAVNTASAFDVDIDGKELFTDEQWVAIMDDYHRCTTKAYQPTFVEVVKEKYLPTLEEHVSLGETLKVEVHREGWVVAIGLTATNTFSVSGFTGPHNIVHCHVEAYNEGLLSIVSKQRPQRD